MTQFDKVLSDNLPFLWQAKVSWENVMWCNFEYFLITLKLESLSSLRLAVIKHESNYSQEKAETVSK